MLETFPPSIIRVAKRVAGLGRVDIAEEDNGNQLCAGVVTDTRCELDRLPCDPLPPLPHRDGRDRKRGSVELLPPKEYRGPVGLLAVLSTQFFSAFCGFSLRCFFPGRFWYYRVLSAPRPLSG